MSESTRLRPCPFCGVPPAVEVFSVDGLRFVDIRCEGKGCVAPQILVSNASESEVFARWNRRPIEDTLRDERDALLTAIVRAKDGEAIKP